MDLVHLLRPLWIVAFMALFVAIVAWALAPRRRARFDADARIPLRED